MPGSRRIHLAKLSACGIVYLIKRVCSTRHYRKLLRRRPQFRPFVRQIEAKTIPYAFAAVPLRVFA